MSQQAKSWPATTRESPDAAPGAALYRPTMGLTLYLVERYISCLDAEALARIEARLRRVTAALRREGLDIHLVRSIALPGDDTCLCFFRASDSDLVLEANRRAGLELERVVEALTAEL